MNRFTKNRLKYANIMMWGLKPRMSGWQTVKSRNMILPLQPVSHSQRRGGLLGTRAGGSGGGGWGDGGGGDGERVKVRPPTPTRKTDSGPTPKLTRRDNRPKC